MVRKAGVAILVVFALFVIASNLSVDQRDIDNWENANYWRDNPRKAYPSWFSIFGGRTPTVFLKPSPVERTVLGSTGFPTSTLTRTSLTT